jgi:hypothetical protein
VREEGACVPVAHPWTTYVAWCESDHEESRLTKTAFDAALANHRFKRSVRENGTVRVWVGLRVRTLADGDAGDDKLTPSDVNL